MNRKEFIDFANNKIPEQLRPLTEDRLRLFIEFDQISEPLYAQYVPKVVQLLGLLYEVRPGQTPPRWPAMVPELHQIIDCGQARETLSAKASALVTDRWLPPGQLFVNVPEQDRRIYLANERLDFATWVGNVNRGGAKFASLVTPHERGAIVSTMRLVESMPGTKRESLESGTVAMEIPRFKQSCVLFSYYVMPDGRLVPDQFKGTRGVDYRYLHRVLSRMADGEIRSVELLLGISFEGMTREEALYHQTVIREALFHPGRQSAEMGLSVSYRTFLTTWPEAIKLHDSEMNDVSSFVLVRRFAGWLDYAYFSLAMEIADALAGRSEIRHCEHCGSVLGAGHHDRRFCLKTENPACARARDADRKRRVRASSK